MQVSLEDEATPVAANGHNPGWQNLVHWLTGQSISMSPATAVLLTGDGARWADAVAQRSWSVDEVVRP